MPALYPVATWTSEAGCRPPACSGRSQQTLRNRVERPPPPPPFFCFQHFGTVIIPSEQGKGIIVSMKMTNIPQTLDWVKERAACTVTAVFNQICNDFEGDIASINAAQNLLNEDRFRMDAIGDGSTVIIGQPSRFPRVVVKVGLVGSEIEVQDGATRSTWRMRIGLNDEGRCVLRNGDGLEMEHWQFRKKALECLFFGDGK
jgi:hypothetical protein